MGERHKVLRRLRVAVGMNQRQFAEAVGINPVYLRQLELKVNPVGHETALKILDRFRPQLLELGITLEEILRDERAA
jgi:transcriptional regulator with XRE-family HTH domain